jgi:hypothetical protein
MNSSRTFAKYKAEMERKKAKVIDEFIRSAMSPIQKSFLKWARKTRDAAKREFGNQVKAGFCLTSLLTRYLKANKEKYTRLAWKKLDHNPDKIMSASFNKMLRAAGQNQGTAWIRWRMYVVSSDRARMKLAKRNLAG